MVSGYLPGQMAGEQDWLRERLEELEQIDRPSASDGERRAAEWLVERFAELGAQARIEAETAHGTYWWPLGIGAALGAVAALRGRRALGALLGTIGAADIGARQIMPGATSPASRLRESTFFLCFLCLESIGSPHLLVIRGEGFLKMHEYPPRSPALMDDLAANVEFDSVADAILLSEAAIRRLGERRL